MQIFSNNGGWSLLKSTAASKDTKHNRMPDNWEQKYGLNQIILIIEILKLQMDIRCWENILVELNKNIVRK